MEDDTAYIPLFAQEQRRQGRSPGTIRVREGQLERVLKAFGSFDAVTPRHLEKWLKDQELNTRTQRNYISNLSAFYRWGVQCNFFDEDPTEGITRPDIQPKHQEIRDKDVAKVLSAASRPEIRAWLVLMAYQGLRCQDIAELRRESVDLEASPPLLKLGDEKTNWGGSTVLHHEVVSSIRALPIVRGSLFPTETSASISRKIARHFAASGVTGSSNSLLWWYRENVQNLGRSFDREVSSGRTREVELTPIELSVVAALDRLVPGESPCYLQAVSDLNDQNRIAFRGVATEFRELVRVVLDVLAPDSTLMASPGFKLEPGQPKPTQIQKARFILKSNRVSTTARAVPETTVELVEDSVATFARNIHRRSSNALHTETDRSEVQQIKMYVDALLTELLEVHRVLQTD